MKYAIQSGLSLLLNDMLFASVSTNDPRVLVFDSQSEALRAFADRRPGPHDRDGSTFQDFNRKAEIVGVVNDEVYPSKKEAVELIGTVDFTGLKFVLYSLHALKYASFGSSHLPDGYADWTYEIDDSTLFNSLEELTKYRIRNPVDIGLVSIRGVKTIPAKTTRRIVDLCPCGANSVG